MTDFTQDTRLRITGSKTGSVLGDDIDVLGDVIGHETYTYNTQGLMNSLIDELNPIHSVLEMTYDANDQLTGFGGATALTYDNRHNISTNNLANRNLSYEYDVNTNLLQRVMQGGAPIRDYAYDIRGNIINDGQQQFVYDQADRLREIPTKNRNIFYDAHGKRVLELTDNTLKTFYFYNLAGQLLFELQQNDGWQQDHIYLGSTAVSKVRLPLAP